MEMGNRYAEFVDKPDSALLCFTIVSGREARTKEEIRLKTTAYIGKWYVYFFHFYDYSNAVENLQQAHELVKENDGDLPRILLNYGCMYQTISEQSDAAKPGRQAFYYYRQAFNEALVRNDSNIVQLSILNLCTVSHSQHMMDSIKGEIARYDEYMQSHTSSPYRYTKLLYQGLRNMELGKYAEAAADFRQQQSLLNSNALFSRFGYTANINLAKALAAMGMHGKALEILKQAEQIATENNIKDARLEVYKLIVQYSSEIRDSNQTEEYRNRFFRLKDTLLNYKQTARVAELDFLNEIKAMDEDMARMKQRQQLQNIAIGIAAAIAMVIAVFLYILWLKNRRLQQANRTLYERSLAMLRKEEEERARRKEYERALQELRAQEKAAKTTETPDTEERKKENAEGKEGRKYKGSCLDDSMKAELSAKILNIIETTDEVYRPEFSADRLEQLTGINYRILSQVINECYGVNFSTFVNDFRIKEACKRFNDTAHYGHYTIEGVGLSVGFRSRSTFFTIFKKMTGLSPSEYQKIALERDGE